MCPALATRRQARADSRALRAPASRGSGPGRGQGMTMLAERTILEQQLWDPDLDAARTELMRSDQERTPVELAVGVHAASAAAMQNQHVADDVNAAARRAYLGITDDVSAKLTPFDRFVVVDVLTQVARCVPLARTHRDPADASRLLAPTAIPLARTLPAAACRLSRGLSTSSRSRLRIQSSSSCGSSSRCSETRRSWWRCAKEWKQPAHCSALKQPSEPVPGARTALCVLCLACQ